MRDIKKMVFSGSRTGLLTTASENLWFKLFWRILVKHLGNYAYVILHCRPVQLCHSLSVVVFLKSSPILTCTSAQQKLDG